LIKKLLFAVVAISIVLSVFLPIQITEAHYSGCTVKSYWDSDDGLPNDQISSFTLSGGSMPEWVTLYSDTNYGGNSQIFIAEDPNLYGNYVGNDAVDSFKITGSCQLVVYTDANFGGTSKTFTGPMVCASVGSTFHDKISSIKIIGCDSSGVILHGGKLCTEEGHLFVSSGTYNLPATDRNSKSCLNDAISSVQVVGSASVTLYGDANKAGRIFPSAVLTTHVSGSGSITPASGTTYSTVQTITLKATPGSGYGFYGWSGAASGSANPTTLLMNGNKDVTATFKPIYTLTTSVASGSGSISPSSGSYLSGTVVTLTATPASCWVFSSWSGALSGATNPTTLTMNSNKVVTATFTKPNYTLTATVPSGGGTITPASGSSYPCGTAITVTAIPAANYVFTGWSGALSGTTNPTTLTMNSNKAIAATFARTYSLTTAVSGSGTVSPASGTYRSGVVVTLTATPASGWTFSGWSGALSGATNPTTITMNANKSVTATFTRPNYTLTTTVASGSGTITPVSGSSYPSGTVITVTAIPAANYVFTGWSGNLSGTTNPTTLTMNSNKAIAATFARTYSLTTAVSGSGTVSPASGTYRSGVVVTLTATPASGWTFAGWSGDLTGTANPTTVTMNANKSVTATFTQPNQNYTFTTSVSGSGTITPASGSSYPGGTVITVTATPASGWSFSGWSGALSGTANPATLTMNANKSVTATFTYEPWSFAIITDLQIGEDIPDYGGVNSKDDDSNTGEEYIVTQQLRQTVNAINNNKDVYKIKFVAVLGDVTQSAENSEILKAKSILDTLNTLQVPWIPLTGNHDIWPYYTDQSGDYHDATNPIDSTTYTAVDYSIYSQYFKPQYDYLHSHYGWNWNISTAPVQDGLNGPKWYFSNMAFDYGGYHFICSDFNSRNADRYGPGTAPEADLHDITDYSNPSIKGTWPWFKNEFDSYINRITDPGYNDIILLSHHGMFRQIHPDVGEMGFVGGENTKLNEFFWQAGHGDRVAYQFYGHLHGWNTGDPVWSDWSKDTGNGFEAIQTIDNKGAWIHCLDPIRIVQFTTPGSIDSIDWTTTLPNNRWLDGWNYRQQFTVNGSADGALTNYQIKLTVHKGSFWFSLGSDVFTNNNCKDDFSDLRFTALDGTTPLDYWIESYTAGDSATVWVEVPSIPASPGSTSLYIYYGNPSATSASNGANTFIFFDDFQDGDYTNNPTWAVNTGSFSAANGYLEHTSSFIGPDISSGAISIPAGTPIMMEYDSMWTSTFCIMNWAGLKDSMGNTMLGAHGVHCDYSGLHGLGLYYNNTSTAQDYVYQDIASGTWHHFSISFDGASYSLDYDHGINGFTIDAPAYANNIVDISLGGWQHQSGSRFDNFRIRKYASSEPSLGGWSSECPQ